MCGIVHGRIISAPTFVRFCEYAKNLLDNVTMLCYTNFEVKHMLISKKDLLNETGISYGQLYRWKREGLIPEDWFIKQPSFTGQETFFPRAKILSRITAIQEMKDKYSLPELAKILSPEVSERNFTKNDLQVIEEVDKDFIPYFITSFGKQSFSFIEMLILIAISKCAAEFDLDERHVRQICEGIASRIHEVKQTDFLFIMVSAEGVYYVLLHKEQTQVCLDARLTQLKSISLNELSSMVKIKYRKSFNLQLDTEEGTLPFSNPIEGTVVT